MVGGLRVRDSRCSRLAGWLSHIVYVVHFERVSIQVEPFVEPRQRVRFVLDPNPRPLAPVPDLNSQQSQSSSARGAPPEELL